MMKIKGIKKQVLLSEKLIQMVEEIQKKNGLLTFTAAIQQVIIIAHRNEFKEYLVKRNKTKSKLKKEEKKTVVTDTEHEGLESKNKPDPLLKKEKICEELGGKVIITDEGEKLCKYYTYEKKKRYEQTVGIEVLSAVNKKNQYFPSKKTVEKLQKEGKTNY